MTISNDHLKLMLTENLVPRRRFWCCTIKMEAIAGMLNLKQKFSG